MKFVGRTSRESQSARGIAVGVPIASYRCRTKILMFARRLLAIQRNGRLLSMANAWCPAKGPRRGMSRRTDRSRKRMSTRGRMVVRGGAGFVGSMLTDRLFSGSSEVTELDGAEVGR